VVVSHLAAPTDLSLPEQSDRASQAPTIPDKVALSTQIARRLSPVRRLHRVRGSPLDLLRRLSNVRRVSCKLLLVSTGESWLTYSSNTIPTDVINFSQSLNVRDPVRVLVRRDGGPNSQESVSSVTPGIHLKHTYVYLTITPSSRSNPADGGAAASSADPNGIGTIGSGRTAAGGGAASQAANEEANRAKEYKLDILGKMLDDYPLWQAIIHVGSFGMLEAVVVSLPLPPPMSSTNRIV